MPVVQPVGVPSNSLETLRGTPGLQFERRFGAPHSSTAQADTSPAGAICIAARRSIPRWVTKIRVSCRPDSGRSGRSLTACRGSGLGINWRANCRRCTATSLAAAGRTATVRTWAEPRNRELLRGCACSRSAPRLLVHPTQGGHTLPPSIELPWQLLRARLAEARKCSMHGSSSTTGSFKGAPGGRCSRISRSSCPRSAIAGSVFLSDPARDLVPGRQAGGAFVHSHMRCCVTTKQGWNRRWSNHRLPGSPGVESLLKIGEPLRPDLRRSVVWARQIAPAAVPLHAEIKVERYLVADLQRARRLLPANPKASFWSKSALRGTIQSFGDSSSMPSACRSSISSRPLKPACKGRCARPCSFTEGGFLSRHRMKVWLPLARVQGGSRSHHWRLFRAFKDRTWDQVDGSWKRHVEQVRAGQ